MKITIFSDNAAPYRIKWADELGRANDVTFYYNKDKENTRNSDWLVKKSEFCKMVKFSTKIVKGKAINFNVIKILKKDHSDIIIFDGYGPIPNVFGIIYMILKRKKYFINIDGIDLGGSNSIIKRLIKKTIFSKYAYFLCSSQYVVEWLKQFGVTEDKTIVHNFTSICEEDILEKVPTDEERALMKEKLSLKNMPTVLGVGRFICYKQFDLLIKAFKELDDKYQLVIIGEGTYKAKYEELISEYGLKNVVILDFMKFEELKKYYFASDLFVLPSTIEVWGLVVNEAMACGALPIITSDRCIAGISLLKDEKGGYLFLHENEIDLREKIEKALENRTVMSAQSLERIRDYTIEKTAKKHLDWFESFINQ